MVGVSETTILNLNLTSTSWYYESQCKMRSKMLQKASKLNVFGALQNWKRESYSPDYYRRLKLGSSLQIWIIVEVGNRGVKRTYLSQKGINLLDGRGHQYNRRVQRLKGAIKEENWPEMCTTTHPFTWAMLQRLQHHRCGFQQWCHPPYSPDRTPLYTICF